jgi:hypothetical protein
MLNILKWDFIKFIKKYYWLYISFAAAFVITSVLPGNIRFFSGIVDGISAVYSIFFYGFTIVVSAAVTISWLRKSSSQLELSLPAKPWKILLSKLVLSICINMSGLFLTELLWMQIGRFGMSKIRLFKGFTGFLQYTTGMLILLIIVMFSYITAKSVAFIRNKSGVATALLSIAICTLIIFLMFIFSIKTGIWSLTDITGYGEFCLTANEKLGWLEIILAAAGPVAVITAGFSGSCILFKNRFERY